MTAPTAREVLRSLERRRHAVHMDALAGIDEAAEAEVRRALRSVKPARRIDVAKLIETIRRSVVPGDD